MEIADNRLQPFEIFFIRHSVRPMQHHATSGFSPHPQPSPGSSNCGAHFAQVVIREIETDRSLKVFRSCGTQSYSNLARAAVAVSSGLEGLFRIVRWIVSMAGRIDFDKAINYRAENREQENCRPENSLRNRHHALTPEADNQKDRQQFERRKDDYLGFVHVRSGSGRVVMTITA